MGKIRVDEITDEVGTGSPSFPNGVAVNQITNEAGDGPPEFPNGVAVNQITNEAGDGPPEFPNGIAVSVITDEAGTGNPSFPNGVPAQSGQISFFAMNTPPTGWLKANGAAVSRTTYSALFGAIGTTFGAGDGSTTFNLPDMRGQFPRGWDDGRGVDSGRAFGSAQTDAFQGHFHARRFSGTRDINIGAGIISRGNDVGTVTDRDFVGAPSDDGSNGAPRTAAETRPRNIALLACIKF